MNLKKILDDLSLTQENYDCDECERDDWDENDCEIDDWDEGEWDLEDLLHDDFDLMIRKGNPFICKNRRNFCGIFIASEVTDLLDHLGSTPFLYKKLAHSIGVPFDNLTDSRKSIYNRLNELAQENQGKHALFLNWNSSKCSALKFGFYSELEIIRMLEQLGLVDLSFYEDKLEQGAEYDDLRFAITDVPDPNWTYNDDDKLNLG